MAGATVMAHVALLAYNHSEAYVRDVLAWAKRYAVPAPPQGYAAPAVGVWLRSVPGAPGMQCDSRIVPDVVALRRAYLVRLTACYGGAPHDLNGEHPLGVATDIVTADGDWSRTLRLASDYGWSPTGAATGCGGRGPFRVVLYNGFPGHGDPSHSSRAHLHLSWEHAPTQPFIRPAWVRTLLRPKCVGRHRLSSFKQAAPQRAQEVHAMSDLVAPVIVPGWIALISALQETVTRAQALGEADAEDSEDAGRR